jgi:hypothetical protein
MKRVPSFFLAKIPATFHLESNLGYVEDEGVVFSTWRGVFWPVLEKRRLVWNKNGCQPEVDPEKLRNLYLNHMLYRGLAQGHILRCFRGPTAISS